jgi:glutathione S-transferase
MMSDEKMKNFQGLELIASKVCPFVQRSDITLLFKGVDYQKTYVDLKNPPQWLHDISPRKKVPVLRIDDSIIYESAVINELLNEITPGDMHPDDPILKAQHRAMIEFGSDLIMEQYRMIAAKDESTFMQHFDGLKILFHQLDQSDLLGSIANAKSLSLVEAAYAPIFVRMALVEDMVSGTNFLDKTPVVQRWAKKLLGHHAVTESIPEDFEPYFVDFFADSYLVSSSVLRPEVVAMT